MEEDCYTLDVLSENEEYKICQRKIHNTSNTDLWFYKKMEDHFGNYYWQMFLLSDTTNVNRALTSLLNKTIAEAL